MENVNIKGIIINNFVITTCDLCHEGRGQPLVWQHKKRLTLDNVVMEGPTVEVIIKLNHEGKKE